jgi:hypothetical protein
VTDHDKALADLHARLGLKRLSPTWAKLEILLGLAASGAGLLAGQYALARPDFAWGLVLGGLALFVLGGYLALAGHPSHLYQSNNLLAAHLAAKLDSLQPPKVSSHEHPR